MSYKRILIPVDGSATSMAGLSTAIALGKRGGAKLTLLHVVDIAAILSMPEAGVSIDIVIDELNASGRQTLADAEKAAKSAQIGRAHV